MPNKMSNKRNAVVLWTGGKDCALALHEAQKRDYIIQKLVTFVPSESQFKAHALLLMEYQSKALGIPHELIPVTEPYKASYQQAMRRLQQVDGVEVLITGDIGEVDGYPNWIRECAEPLGLYVDTPLWGRNSLELLNRYVSAGLKVILSCVKSPWLTEDWLGKEITIETIQQLQMKQTETGLDLCGEQGEYHSIVLDGPLFKQEIRLHSYEKCREESLMYIKVKQLVLQNK